ncbi:MAG: helix-turn-helix domain containing protein [Treponema sp.]|nr:helix-turn-helix domain containing protein [Treponema sp.]
MGFRENLKAELYCSGILVKELAARTGIKKHTIDNYLSVRGRMPAADVAVRIARVLGVTVEYLVTGSDAPENLYPMRLSLETRKTARVAEQLKPDYRKIALSLVTSLKKHQEAADSRPE